MILALQGDAARLDAEAKLTITAGYLAGAYSQADLSKSPTLAQLVGDEPAAPETGVMGEGENSRSNALAWIAVLGGGPSTPETKEADDA